MSSVNRGSAPLNQPLKLPGGATITRPEMAALFKSRNITLGKGFVFEGDDNPDHPDEPPSSCGQYCEKCQFSCDPNSGSFGELYDIEAAALIQAGKITLSSLNNDQLRAIRPTAQDALKNNPSLEKQLSNEQLKSIRG